MIERLARLGFASIGIVYVVIGVLAVVAERTTGHEGAVAYLLYKPFGRPLLAIMLAGLIGYTLWLLVSAVADSDRRGDSAKGLAIRVGAFFRGLIYAAFSIEIARLLSRGASDSGSGDERAEHWTGRLMAQPFGPWLVAMTGLGIIGYGAYQLYRAWESKLSKRLHLSEVSTGVVTICRFGIGARGIVFVIIGGSLVLAAMRHNPDTARGTSGAFDFLPEPILTAVGCGFVAYGVYAFVNARYRSIET